MESVVWTLQICLLVQVVLRPADCLTAEAGEQRNQQSNANQRQEETHKMGAPEINLQAVAGGKPMHPVV